MPFSASSSVFDPVRASTTALGLTPEQVRAVVAYVNRSATFTARMTEFESVGGTIRYSDTDTNFFWVADRTIYVSPVHYQNGLPGANDADIETLIEVLAHEMSHFVSYFREELNPNNCASCDEAAVMGVRDEARAYAHEYVVQREINATRGEKVDWMKEGQLEAIEPHVAGLSPDADSATVHAAATKALLDWAANWSGPVESAGGYFEFYRNEWLKLANKATQKIEPRSVTIVCDAEGNILEIKYRDRGTLVATTVARNAATGVFA
jgi:hypothetical protein